MLLHPDDHEDHRVREIHLKVSEIYRSALEDPVALIPSAWELACDLLAQFAADLDYEPAEAAELIRQRIEANTAANHRRSVEGTA